MINIKKRKFAKIKKKENYENRQYRELRDE